MKIWTYKLTLFTDSRDIDFRIIDEDNFKYNAEDDTFDYINSDFSDAKTRFNYFQVLWKIDGRIETERSFSRKLNNDEIKHIKGELSERIKSALLKKIIEATDFAEKGIVALDEFLYEER